MFDQSFHCTWHNAWRCLSQKIYALKMLFIAQFSLCTIDLFVCSGMSFFTKYMGLVLPVSIYKDKFHPFCIPGDYCIQTDWSLGCHRALLDNTWLGDECFFLLITMKPVPCIIFHGWIPFSLLKNLFNPTDWSLCCLDLIINKYFVIHFMLLDCT